jgi:hypothetical protein
MTRKQTKEGAVRHLSSTFLAALTVALCAAPVAAAHPPHNDRGPLVTPTYRLGGLTGGELLGEQLFLAHSLPPAENPAFGNGNPCLRLGHRGEVLAPLFGGDVPVTCTVKPGTPVFIFGWYNSCSNVELPPSYGKNEAEQRACARAGDQAVQALRLTVDDEPVNIHTRRFEVFTPQRKVQLPEGNILGVPPQKATFTAHGWVATVSRLSPGRHTIQVEVVLDAGPPDGVITFVRGTLVVNVVRHGDDN